MTHTKEYYREYRKTHISWEKRNPEKAKIMKKKWRDKNPEKAKEIARKNFLHKKNNPDLYKKHKANVILWQEKNPEKVKEYHKRASRNYHKKNHEKERIYKNKWRKNNEKRREYEKKWKSINNLKKYSMTKKDFEITIKEQNNVCAICEREKTKVGKGKREFSVDHDHITGKKRGLLCTSCNLALGLLKDNIKSLENAIKYLQFYKLS